VTGAHPGWSALFVVLPLAACGDVGAFEQEATSSFFTAAPERVHLSSMRSLGPLPSPDSAILAGSPGLAVEPEGVDYVLGKPEDVEEDGSGRLWIVDSMQREVLAFHEGGALAQRFGGRGRGPGEYEEPGAMMRLPWNDHLAVWDGPVQRLTILTPGGEVVRTLRFGSAAASPIPAFGQSVRRVRAWSGGFIVEEHSDPLRTPPAAQRGHLLRLDTLGQVKDTVVAFAIPAVHAEIRGNHTNWKAPPLFTPTAHWDVFPDGTLVFAPGGPYAVYVIPPTGGALRVVREAPPERVTRRDRLRRLEEERNEGRIGRSDLATAAIERVTRDRFALARPAVTGVLADPTGRVWVRRFDTASDGLGRSTVWDVYAVSGDPIATVRLDPGVLPRRVAGRRLLGVVRDEVGLRSVVAYELPPFPTRSPTAR
jgi:hypothetical protein